MTKSQTPTVPLLLFLSLGAALLVGLGTVPDGPRQVAAYTTSLVGRSPGQRHNARLAAQALDGRTVAPGATFSFNHAVDSWSVDDGYLKAPVSYDGELIRAYGGGVCQTSTTLYNAALLAGLPIVERHAHVFRPHYIAPGRDAAVAFPGSDLRFRNPYPWPLRISADASGDRLRVRLTGRGTPPDAVRITTEVLSSTRPARLVHGAAGGGSEGRTYLRSPGTTGYRVVTWRSFSRHGHEVRRERLADDAYPVMDRVVAVTDAS